MKKHVEENGVEKEKAWNVCFYCLFLEWKFILFPWFYLFCSFFSRSNCEQVKIREIRRNKWEILKKKQSKRENKNIKINYKFRSNHFRNLFDRDQFGFINRIELIVASSFFSERDIVCFIDRCQVQHLRCSHNTTDQYTTVELFMTPNGTENMKVQTNKKWEKLVQILCHNEAESFTFTSNNKSNQ